MKPPICGASVKAAVLVPPPHRWTEMASDHLHIHDRMLQQCILVRLLLRQAAKLSLVPALAAWPEPPHLRSHQGHPFLLGICSRPQWATYGSRRSLVRVTLPVGGDRIAVTKTESERDTSVSESFDGITATCSFANGDGRMEVFSPHPPSGVPTRRSWQVVQCFAWRPVGTVSLNRSCR
jgi:hypothetical protein